MTYLVFFAALFVVCLIFGLLRKPLKFLLKIAINALVGAILLLIINFFGGAIGLNVPITVFTSLIVGCAGVFGLIALVLISFIFPGLL